MNNQSKIRQKSSGHPTQSCISFLWKNADKTLLILDTIEKYRKKATNGQSVISYSQVIYFNAQDLLEDNPSWCAYAKAVQPWDGELAAWLKSNAHNTAAVMEQVPIQVQLAGSRHGNCIIVVENADLLPKILTHPDLEILVKLTQPVFAFVFIGYEELANLPVGHEVQAVCCRAIDYYMELDQLYGYYSAKGVIADTATFTRIYELTQGWLYAVVLLNTYLKHNHLLTSNDVDLAITGFYNELDNTLFTNAEQELRTAVLLSQFDEFSNQMAVEITPFSEGVVKRCLDMLPGKQYCNGGEGITLHPLIHNYLQSKLYKIPKKMRDACLTRAATWYWEQGKHILAIQCSIASKDFMNVRRILQTLNVYTLDADTYNLSGALATIKPVDLRKHPMLWVYTVVALFTAEQTVEATAQKKKLEKYLAQHNQTDEQQQALGELHCLNGFLAFGQQNGVQSFKKADQYLNQPSEIWNGQSAGFVAQGLSISFVEKNTGTLLESMRLQKELEPYVYRLCNDWGRGFADLSLAEYHYFSGNDEAVLQHAGCAVAQAVAYNQWDIAMFANYLLMKQHIQAGRYADALYSWRNIYSHMAMAPQTGMGENLKDLADFTLYTITNQIYLAADWIKADQLADDVPKPPRPLVALYVRCVYKYMNGDNIKALSEIDEALGKTRHQKRWSTYARLMVLKLMVLLRLNMVEPACWLLADVYANVRRHNCKIIITEYGEELAGLAQLTEKAKALGIKTPPKVWLNSIIAQGQSYADIKKKFCKQYFLTIQQRYDSTFTQTEYIALQMACIGYTRREIAARLNVNPKYITAIMNKVCSKLHVFSADAAISVGISMGMQIDRIGTNFLDTL